MNNKTNLLIIHGTNRGDSKSGKVAQFISDTAMLRDDFNIENTSPLKIALSEDGNDKSPHYQKLLSWCDAILIVSPEYNYSFPGSLKTLLDSEFALYKYKVVALAGVSDGPWGGVRMIESIIPTIRKFGMIISSFDLMFPNVDQLINESGVIEAPQSVDRINRSLNEIVHLVNNTKGLRE